MSVSTAGPGIATDGRAVDRPPSRRRSHTRARLLEGARAVIAEQGVKGASVEEICECAGFTRGAFYSNFAGKDDLLMALAAADFEDVLARTRDVLADPPDDAVAVVAAVMDRLRDGDARQRYLTRTELTLHALRSPAFAVLLTAARAEFRLQLGEAVQRAAERTGRTLLLDPDVLVRTVEALHDGATAQSLLQPEELPDGALQRAVLPHLILAPEPADR